MRNIIPGFPENIAVPKAQAKRLASALSDRLPLSHAQSLEVIAKVHGQESWGHMRAVLERGADASPVIIQSPVVDVPDDEKDGDAIPNILIWDLLAIMNTKRQRGVFVHRAMNTVHSAWPSLSDGQDIRLPRPLLTRGALRIAAKRELRHENEKLGPLLLDLIMQGFDDLHSLTHWKARPWRTSEMRDKLVMDGFRIIPEFSTTWAAAIDRKHALFYTDNLQNSLNEMMRAGLHVHDLSETKDWSRLATLLGSGCERYVMGPSGLSTLIGNLGFKAPKFKPTQVVALSLREGLVSNMDVLLAQARSCNIHILVHWDIGVTPTLSDTQREHLMSIFTYTHRSLAHVSEKGLWSHRCSP